MWHFSVSRLYEDHEQTVHSSARPRCLLIQALQALIVAVGGSSHNGHLYMYETTSPSTLCCEIGCAWKGSPCSALIVALGVVDVVIAEAVLAVVELGVDVDAAGATECEVMPTGPNSFWRRCIRPGSSFAGIRSMASMRS